CGLFIKKFSLCHIQHILEFYEDLTGCISAYSIAEYPTSNKCSQWNSLKSLNILQCIFTPFNFVRILFFFVMKNYGDFCRFLLYCSLLKFLGERNDEKTTCWVIFGIYIRVWYFGLHTGKR